jgi:hypothetical protein
MAVGGNIGSKMFGYQKGGYKTTPLHIATFNNDTKMKELILNFM